MLNKLVRLLSAKVKSVDLDLAFTAEELSPGIKNIHQSKCGVKIETYIGNDEIENKKFYSEASATYAESFDFLK